MVARPTENLLRGGNTQACGPLDQVHRIGRRLCRKMTYLFNPYFCVNKLENKSADNFLLSLVCKWYPPPHKLFIWPSLLMKLVYMQQITKGFMFPESCSAVSSIETWCKRWNIKINNGHKNRTFYFSHKLRPPRFISLWTDRTHPSWIM
jgi:hypothetical protein